MSLIPQCTGKQRYPTAPAAYRMLRRHRQRQHAGGRVKRHYTPIKVYRCPDCQGGWHVGQEFQAGAINWGLLVALALSLAGWWGIALLLPHVGQALAWWR